MIDVRNTRKEVRAKRAAICGAVRATKSQQASQFILEFMQQIEPVEEIGLFLSIAEEIDTHYLIETLFQRQKKLFLPIVTAKGAALQWRAYHQGEMLNNGALNIPVPAPKNDAPDRQNPPKMVVAPLVAYDACGHRIGMGGGFYDRSFAGKVRGQAPYLIGMAYACQEIPLFTAERWDIPLDALGNENGLIQFK